MPHPEESTLPSSPIPHWVLLGTLALSLGYFSWAGIQFFQGERGVLRGALLWVCASLFLLGKYREDSWESLYLKRIAILILGAGVFDLLLHHPGARVLGIEPRQPDDFLINLTAAREMYGFGRPPYGIQQEFDLSNASISFPFPTYWIYWLASGFGHLDEMLSGFLFTGINLIATMLLICRSFRLAGMRVAQAELFWLLLFLSPLWGCILVGQTPTLAAACIVVGWLHLRSPLPSRFLLGTLLLALGILIKPNFAPVLLGLFFDRETGPGRRRPLIMLGGVILAIPVLLSITLLIPGGVTLETYRDFLQTALPRAMAKVDATNNLSLVGAFVRCTEIRPGLVAMVFGVGLIGYGLWKKKDWRYWFVLPLAVSPITWNTYLALVLPVQFSLAGSNSIRTLFALILSAAWVSIAIPGAGTIGLLTLLLLAGPFSQEAEPGNR